MIEMERHLRLAQRFPFLQRPHWVKHTVLQAGDWLEKLSGEDQIACAALLDQEFIPPADAIAILENLVKMPPDRRAGSSKRPGLGSSSSGVPP